MDFKSMRAHSWVLFFVFLIFVPGSINHIIESTPATLPTAAPATILRTITSTTRNLNATPSFLENNSTAESTTTNSKETLSAARGNVLRRTTNVNFFVGKRALLNTLVNEADSTLTATRNTTIGSIEAEATAPQQATVTESLLSKIQENAPSRLGHNSLNIIKDISRKVVTNAALENRMQTPSKQPRPLQKPKTHYHNRHEYHLQLEEQNDGQLKQHHIRQVQPEFGVASTTAAAAITLRNTMSELEEATAANSILFASDKTIAEAELQIKNAVNLQPVPTLATPLPTARKVTSPATTTVLKTAVARHMAATTTSKPASAIDDYQTITSQAGTHAYLPCNVKQLVKKPISWLRVRDGHILTVDQTTFIADQRFQSIFTPNPERWSLQIKYVQLKDAGTYECQVSTEPKASAIVNLRIIEPKTEMIGESTRHVKAGSQVKLRCIISQALEPPLFINWFYNQKQIYLHNRKGWRTEIERIDDLLPETPATITGREAALAAAGTTHSSLLMIVGSSLATVSEATSPVLGTIPKSTPPWMEKTVMVASDVKQITIASLIIPAVEKLDSGNYTCSPSNSAPMTVVLHVLNGEYSASAITSGVSAILHGRSNHLQVQLHCGNVAAILALLWIIKFLLQTPKFSCNTNDNNNGQEDNNHVERNSTGRFRCSIVGSFPEATEIEGKT